MGELLQVFLVLWRIRVHGRVLRLERVWRKLDRGILRGGLEVVEERNIFVVGRWCVAAISTLSMMEVGIIIQVKKSSFSRGSDFFSYRAYRSLVKPLRAEDTSMP